MDTALITLIASAASTGVAWLAKRASTISDEKRREMEGLLRLEWIRAKERARQAEIYVR